jgi:hypothetical protein
MLQYIWIFVHTGPNHLFQNYFNREDALAAMFDIGWGSSTKPLKGYPNYISYPKCCSNWPITRDSKSEVQISMYEMRTVKSEFRGLRSEVWRYLSAYVWRPRPTSFDNYIKLIQILCDKHLLATCGLWFVQ